MNNLIIFSAKYLYFFDIGLVAIYFLIQTKSKQKSIIVLSAIFLPLAYIVAQLSAIFYFDPRPYVVEHFTPLIAHISDNGFPSDHVLLTSAIASVLFVYNKKIGTLAWIITAIVGISRVFAGVHHFIDIVGSVVIVIVSMWITRKYILPQISQTKLYQRYFESQSL